jgi:hypothetical protein
MTTAEIQRRFEKLKQKREMLAKYEKIWFGGGSFQEFYRKAGEQFPEGKDFCPICQCEIDISIREHFKIIHETNLEKIIKGDTDMENNELLEEGIIKDIDRWVRD